MFVTDLKSRMTEEINTRRKEARLIVTTPELWDEATVTAAWRFLKVYGAKDNE
jgi:hypothetical protein